MKPGENIIYQNDYQPQSCNSAYVLVVQVHCFLNIMCTHDDEVCQHGLKHDKEMDSIFSSPLVKTLEQELTMGHCTSQ